MTTRIQLKNLILFWTIGLYTYKVQNTEKYNHANSSIILISHSTHTHTHSHLVEIYKYIYVCTYILYFVMFRNDNAADILLFFIVNLFVEQPLVDAQFMQT